MKSKTIIVSTCLWMTITAATCHAGTLAEFRVTDTSGRSLQTAFISGGRVSVQDPNTPGGSELIYHSGSDRVDIIQHGDRTFSRLDRAVVDKMAGQAADVRDIIADNTSPEQQEQLAGMLDSFGLSGLVKQAPAGSIRHERTNEQRIVSGYPCQVVRMIRNDRLETVVCVASREALRLPDNDYDVLRSMLSFSSYLSDRASGLLDGIGGTLPDLDPVDIEGLPIAVTDLDDGVTVVLQRLVPMPDKPGGLAVPKGYSETALPGIL